MSDPTRIHPSIPSGEEENGVPERIEETLSELFVALTARTRRDGRRLKIGVERQRLLEALDVSAETLSDCLRRLDEHIEPLGLERVEYYYDRELWLTLRSVHPCPNELGPDAQATLGVVMGLIEEGEAPEAARIPVSELRALLVRGRYLTEHQLDVNLKNLESLGFLHRSRAGVGYGPRTLIEYSPSRRANIRNEARELIF